MTEVPDRLPDRPGQGAMSETPDVLSDVLRGVRLTGAMLFLVDATTPWRTQAPAARVFARAVMPAAQQLVSFHVVTEGMCWGGLEAQAPQRLQAGDILVVPHGDPYVLASPPDAQPMYDDEEATSFFRRMAAGELPVVVNEGGGGEERTRFLCGFLGCDVRPFNPVLAALPRVMHLRRTTQAGERLTRLVDLALLELRDKRAGRREVLLRLSELMFVELVRSHVTGAAGPGPHWLAGLRDPLVSRALACLHAAPARAWTLQTLARELGTSRSTLAERFACVMGQPPMRYLGAWRMQLAARMLTDGQAKVRAAAEAVGFASESAFSRAFKAHTGLSPRNWRRL